MSLHRRQLFEGVAHLGACAGAMLRRAPGNCETDLLRAINDLEDDRCAPTNFKP